MKSIFLHIMVVSFVLVFSFSNTMAQEIVRIPIQEELENQGVQLDLGAIVSSFINLAITLAVIVLFFYFILGGYKWLTSSGDKAKVEEARSTITNGLIGLAIMASIYAIMAVVTAFFGIDIGLTTGPGGPSQAEIDHTSCPSGMTFDEFMGTCVGSGGGTTTPPCGDEFLGQPEC